MKTIKFLFTVTAVAIVAIATAVEKPKLNVVPLTADRAIVSIENQNSAYFELSIESDNGNVVYYKQSKKPLTNYQKVFDFTDLSNGSYVMTVKVNDTELSRNFEVAQNEIQIGESKLRFDPYFDFENNVLKFSYLNFDENNMRLNIYNENGLIYQNNLGDDLTLTAGYDFSKLENGNYRVVLSSFKNEFVYNVEK